MDPAALRAAAHFTEVTRCSHVAAYSLLVWDWLICFAQERRLIFGSRWTFAKVAYLVSRYYPLFVYPIIMWVQMVDHDKSLCGRIFNLPIVLVIPNNVSAEIILILRTYAFTGANKPVLGSLLFLLCGLAAFQIWIATTQSKMIPFGTGCFPVNIGSAMFLSGFFISTFLFDCIITGIFVFHAFRVMRLRLTVATRLTQLLIREGFLYFCLISVVNLVNGAFNLQNDNIAMATGAVPLSLLFCNVLSCRLVLNLRQAAREEAIPGGIQSPDKTVFDDDEAPLPPPKDEKFSHGSFPSGSWGISPETVHHISPTHHIITSGERNKWDVVELHDPGMKQDVESRAWRPQRPGLTHERADSSMSGSTLVNYGR